MPRRARIEFVSLRSSLVNLPISIYGPLVEHHVRPQNLAVHLLLISGGTQGFKTKETKQCYVGWTGMASSSSLARFKAGATSSDALETIEIDPQFASDLGFGLGSIVEIGLLHDLPIATSVVTEPYSADDWEIIELHAAYVEQNLLSQVRAATVGQEVDVWVFGRTRARLRVVSFEPSSAKHEAILLGTNTEVSIAPKKRSNAVSGKSLKHTSNTETKPTGEDVERPKYLKHARRRALPATFFSFSESDPPSNPIAWVSIGTFCALASKPIPLSKSDGFGPISVRHLKAPTDPLASEPAPPASTAPPAAKVIHSADASQGAPSTTEPAESHEETITLRWSREVPDKQVVFQNYANVKAWENCLLISSTLSKLFSIPDTEISAPRRVKTGYDHGLAGVDAYMDKCTSSLRNVYILHDIMDKTVPSVLGTLILGRPGSGKTSIANAVSRLTEDSQFHAHIIHADFAKHADDRVPRLKAYFKYLFEKAHWHKPSVLVFDNLDKVLSAEVENADSFRSRQLTELFLNVFMYTMSDTKGMTMIATAQSETSLHPRVHKSHLFKETIKLKPPGKDGRRDIIAQCVKTRMGNAQDLSISTEIPLNFAALATQTEGYLPTDLEDLVSHAVHEAVIRSGREVSKMELLPVDFEKAQADFVPLSLRDIKLQKSDVSWNDIGGLHEPRKMLRETLEWPTKYSAIFANCPIRLRSGILLYGYPGCGKTLLASAVAKECGLNFISVKGPELLNKYIGASEKSVRDLFDRASAAKPCVLFFDEFDSIAPKRGHDSTGVTDRVVNQMLTQMDGAEGLDGVYVLAATSRPDLIDSALLRPGRLDKSLLCDMPNFEERKEILQVVSKKITVSPTVDWDALATVTEGYSGADLQAIIYNAHLDVVHSTLAEKREGTGPRAKGKGKEVATTDGSVEADDEPRVDYFMFGGSEETPHRSRAEEAALQRKLRMIIASRSSSNLEDEISTPQPEKLTHEVTDAHLHRSLASTRPSVSSEEQSRLRRIYRAFVSDRSGEMPMPPDAGTVGSRATLM
ncbi:hypothetical protein M0805_001452 [Coniferiporia weirii]|nr:hypothetical protein M0805_001452 [Coniferiporia weirii]